MTWGFIRKWTNPLIYIKQNNILQNYKSHDAVVLLGARVSVCGMKGALVEFGNFQKPELLTLDAAELSLSSRNMDVCLLSTSTTMLLLSKCVSKFIY